MAELKAYVVRMMCSRLGRRFIVQFGRSNRGLLEITLIRSEETLQASGHATTHQKATSSSLSSTDFDWTGFWCPHCGHRKTNGISFVQCGTCQELVCAGTLSSPDGQQQYFTCYSACGNSGYLSGQITNYDCTSSPTSSSRALASGPSQPAALPPRRSQLLARRK